MPYGWIARILILAALLTGCAGGAPATSDDSGLDTDATPDLAADLLSTPTPTRRVPAEWEPHTGTWMQWPGPWEATARSAFADIIAVVGTYEPVHLLVTNEAARAEAEDFLADRGVLSDDIHWHLIPVDSSWMRDNGPIYVVEDGALRLQDWSFDAWGGNFGPEIPYTADDAVPLHVGASLGLPVDDRGGYVLERGNLEFNGGGTLILNWDCQDNRNPGMTAAEHEAILAEAFGLTRIIWAYGHDATDGTTGHIDGVARFVDADTIAIAQTTWGAQTEDALAAASAAAGLEIVRVPCPGETDYMNWLVGNGFVVAMAFGDAPADAAAKALLEELFPGRDVHMIDANTLWTNGGGIHCVTNDQPAAP
ncbi:MAG: agmatine deiminase family protein [Pseudomonadota bacterium]